MVKIDIIENDSRYILGIFLIDETQFRTIILGINTSSLKQELSEIIGDDGFVHRFLDALGHIGILGLELR